MLIARFIADVARYQAALIVPDDPDRACADQERFAHVHKRCNLQASGLRTRRPVNVYDAPIVIDLFQDRRFGTEQCQWLVAFAHMNFAFAADPTEVATATGCSLHEPYLRILEKLRVPALLASPRQNPEWRRSSITYTIGGRFRWRSARIETWSLHVVDDRQSPRSSQGILRHSGMPLRAS